MWDLIGGRESLSIFYCKELEEFVPLNRLQFIEMHEGTFLWFVYSYIL